MTRLSASLRGRTTRSAALVSASLALAALALSARASAPGCRYTAPGGRYKASDTTVLDRRTGLVWQRAAQAPAGHGAAAAGCSGDPTDGGGWRLPTTAELQSIIDVTVVSPAIDPVAFPATPSARFWTSDPYVRLPGAYWAVDFSDGTDEGADPTTSLPFRCVKDLPVAP